MRTSTLLTLLLVRLDIDRCGRLLLYSCGCGRERGCHNVCVRTSLVLSLVCLSAELLSIIIIIIITKFVECTNSSMLESEALVSLGGKMD